MGELPASETLWRQTLEKLSRAPYQFSQHCIAPTTNDYASTFQELIADFVRAESFAAVTGDTNRIAECELAVRLPADRAEFWRTNLLTILESWTGARGESFPLLGGVRGGSASVPAGAAGWQLKKHHDPNLVRLVRFGDWMLIGCGQDQLPLQDEYLQRIKQTGSPVAQSDPLLGGVRGGYWLEIFLDMPNLPDVWSSAFRRSGAAEPPEGGTPNPQPSTLNSQPTVNLSLSGRDSNLRLKGDFAFRDPLSWKPEPWQIPTNLVRDPIISFTAVQGFAPMLKNHQEALGLRLDPLPDQLFVWAGASFPVQTLAAAPMKDAAGFLRDLAPQLIAQFNPELQVRQTGGLVLATNLSAKPKCADQ